MSCQYHSTYLNLSKLKLFNLTIRNFFFREWSKIKRVLACSREEMNPFSITKNEATCNLTVCVYFSARCCPLMVFGSLWFSNRHSFICANSKNVQTSQKPCLCTFLRCETALYMHRHTVRVIFRYTHFKPISQLSFLYLEQNNTKKLYSP